MDHLRALRLLGWFTVGFAFAWLALWVPYAHAYPAMATQSNTMWRYNLHGNLGCGQQPASGYVYESAAAACAATNPVKAAEQAIGACGGGAGSTVNGTGAQVTPSPLTYQCKYRLMWNGSLYNADAAVGGGVQQGTGTLYSCPNGGTLSGTTCVCPVGTNDTGTACNATPVVCDYPKTRDAGTNTCVCPTAGTNAATNSLGPAPFYVERPAGAAQPSTGCFEGCAQSYNWPSITIWSVEADGSSWAYIDRSRTTYTGATCTPNAATEVKQDASPTPVDKTCPQGQVWGEVNGVGDCYPGNTKTEGTKTNPNGTQEVQTVTKFENTICTGTGSCTTTVTTNITTTFKDAQGNVTGSSTQTTTETKPGDGSELGAFCAKNPKAKICEGAGGSEYSSSFGGTCGAFTCEGDAIQCAIAKEQHTRNCEFYGSNQDANKTTASDFWTKAKNGTGIGDNFIPRGDPIQASTLDTGSRINAGSCPSPSNIVTPLGSVTLDWTNLCPWFEYFGYIVLFTCLLIAAKVSLGGILGMG